MTILSSKSVYWMFVLRLIGRDDIINWADSLIASDNKNIDLYDLSTCGQMDDNDIMARILNIDYDNDTKTITIELLNALRDYYLKFAGEKFVNLSLLSDFEHINDLSEDIREEIAWLSDRLSLQREGMIIFNKNEAESIIFEIDKMISAQQVDAPESDTMVSPAS